MKAKYTKYTLCSILAGLAMMGFVTSADAQQKTVRACEAEWKANKAAIQASGKKKTDFMKECRFGGQAAATEPGTATTPQQTQPQQPAPTTQQPAQAQQPTQVPAQRTPTSPTQRQTLTPGQYASEAQAKAHCPTDTVVWVNTKSKIYHYPGTRSYGNTKSGAYMCEKETSAAGARAAKNERRPS